jgi:PAS domain S-box-containing protein
MPKPDATGSNPGIATIETGNARGRPRPAGSPEAGEMATRTLALVSEHTRNGVVLTDAAGQVEWANAAFCRITGFTLAEIAGRTAGSVLQGPDTDPATVAIMSRQVRAGEAFEAEVVNYHKSGRPYWVSVEVCPVRDSSGVVTNFVGVQTDVTARKRAEIRLRAQLDAAQVLMGRATVEEAIPRLLAIIAGTLRLEGGEYWLADAPAGVLRLSRRIWADARPDEDSEAATTGLMFAKGEELPGRCWAAGHTEVGGGIDGDPGSSTDAPAAPAGPRRLVAFPIIAEGEVLGVMSLVGRSSLAIDSELGEMLDTLGRQIGLFVERRSGEDRLHDAEARSRTILESAADGVVIIDERGSIDSVNPAAERIFSYAAGEVVGRNVSVLMPEPHGSRHDTYIARYLQSGEPHIVGQSTRVEGRRRDGSTIPLELTVSEFRLGERRMFTAIARDVSERERIEAELRRSREDLEERVLERTADLETAVSLLREEMADRTRAEVRLRESEQRFRTFAEAMPQLVWTCQPDGGCDYVNRQWVEYTGMPTSKQLGIGWLEVLHPDDRERTLACSKRASEGNVDYDLEYRIRGANGSFRWFQNRGVALRDEAGHVVQWLGTCTDVDDRKRAEEALRRAYDELEERVRERTAELVQVNRALHAEVVERLRVEDELRERQRFIENLAEANPAILFLYEVAGGRFVWLNHKTSGMLGYGAEEVLGSGDSFFARVLHPDDASRFLGPESRRRYDDVDDDQIIEQQYQMKHLDGSWHWLRTRALVFHRDAAGRPEQLLVAAEDVTDRKQFETALDEGVRLAMLSGDIGVALTHWGTRREILQACTEILVERLDVAFARIWILDESSEMLELEASAGLYTHIDGGHSRVKVGEYKIGEVARQRRPHLTNQVIGDPRVGDQEWARREGMVAFAGHPLIVDDRLLGVMGLFACRPLSDATLEALGSVADGIVLGIDRKRAEQKLLESEQRFRQVADGVPVVLSLSNPRDGVTFMNKTGVEFFGRPEPELLGRTFYEFLHPDDRRPCRDALVDASTRLAPVQAEYRLRRHDGQYRWMTNSLVPRFLSDGTLMSYVGSMTDVTERREAEDMLRRAKETAEAATRAKGEFLANMSHEIRTPMNGILGMLDLTLRSDIRPRQREFLDLAKSSAENLLRLLNDILDFSKIEAGKLELAREPFRLRDSIDEILRGLSLTAELKDVELIYSTAPDVPDSLVGDPGRLAQVLVNLVGNATKFTERGEVAVRVETDARDAGAVTLHVAVRDTGIGIPAEKKDLIFSSFTQAESSTTRRYGGTGLGLTICTCLVEAMGGHIWVESQVGVGSTFHFTARFELADATATAGRPESPDGENGGSAGMLKSEPL